MQPATKVRRKDGRRHSHRAEVLPLTPVLRAKLAEAQAQREADEARAARDCSGNRVVSGHVFRLDWHGGERCWCHDRPLGDLIGR